MSQKVDYSKSVIYKLCCKDPLIEDIYIGSTTNMKVRKGQHKTDCNNKNIKAYNQNNYQFIRENGGFDNWDMIMIEEYSCNSKTELQKKERYWFDELKPSLNSIRPYATKEELKESLKQKVKCDLCNSTVLKSSLKKHKNSDKCKKYHLLLFSDED